MILDGEPDFLTGPDGKPSKWANTPLAKRWALQAAGKAQGVMIVNDALSDSSEFRASADKAFSRVLNPSFRLSPPGPTFPVALSISRDVADRVFNNVNTSMTAIKEQIAQARGPRLLDLEHSSAEAKFEALTPLDSENVITLLDGSDPLLKNEFVVVSSHYDHLGIDSTLSGHQIYNGAADDGSGTVALLEIASAFSRAKAEGKGPRRSLIFLHTSGEEAGLLGSSYFVDEEAPILLDSIAVDLNLDGIAGFDPKHPRQSRNYVYVINQPAELGNVVARAQRDTGFEIEVDPHSDFNFDNRSFWRHQIPSVYFSTGLVENYHKPSDQANTIDYEHFARAVRLSFATAWELANQSSPIAGRSGAKPKKAGYVCPPCASGCDDIVYESRGTCPICGMSLVEKLS